MSHITFSDISISFEEKDILNNFNLEIQRGEKIRLTAPSGSGKTTLFRMLLGFVCPDTGIVSVDGIEIDGGTVTGIRKKIAYLSQDIDFSEGPAGEVITEILNFHHNKSLGVSLDEVKEEAATLELSSDIWSRPMGKLSGGERQRLGIAMVMALKREILLFDEPTSALDAKMKRKVKDRILQSEKTVLIVSHDNIWKNAAVKTLTW